MVAPTWALLLAFATFASTFPTPPKYFTADETATDFMIEAFTAMEDKENKAEIHESCELSEAEYKMIVGVAMTAVACLKKNASKEVEELNCVDANPPTELEDKASCSLYASFAIALRKRGFQPNIVDAIMNLSKH